MIVSVKLNIAEGSVYTEELSNFLGTQASLMQSGVVNNRAHERVKEQRPELSMHPVELKVTVLHKTTIFVLQATGVDPEYTQAFLQAVMEEYIALKKEMRNATSDSTLAGLTKEVERPAAGSWARPIRTWWPSRAPTAWCYPRTRATARPITWRRSTSGWRTRNPSTTFCSC